MNTLDARAVDENPRADGVNAVLRIKLFVAGALFGATCLLFVVLMQWHAPHWLGRSIDWLPARSMATQQIKVMARVIVMVPSDNAVYAAPASLTPPAVNTALPARLTDSVHAMPAVEQAGELLIPVAGIAQNQLTDTFKDARGTGRAHDAIDIMAPKGTPVFAVNDGKIVKLFNSKQGGLTMYQFDPSEAHAYYYAHLDSYASGMLEGKRVRRGELIGYVGSTGNASPDAPHLHFAVFVLGPEKNWWQGTAVNPFTLLNGNPL